MKALWLLSVCGAGYGLLLLVISIATLEGRGDKEVEFIAASALAMASSLCPFLLALSIERFRKKPNP
jgi:hypothetical protein